MRVGNACTQRRYHRVDRVSGCRLQVYLVAVVTSLVTSLGALCGCDSLANGRFASIGDDTGYQPQAGESDLDYVGRARVSDEVVTPSGPRPEDEPFGTELELEEPDDELDEDDSDDEDPTRDVAGEMQDLEDQGWTQSEIRVLELVNALRIEGISCRGVNMPSVAPLEARDALWRSAKGHSLDMLERDFFSHQAPPPDASSPFDRMQAEGASSYGSENIAAGQITPEQVVQSWRGSAAGHCENMMLASWRYIGVGHAAGEGLSQEGYLRHYWTQNFN